MYAKIILLLLFISLNAYSLNIEIGESFTYSNSIGTFNIKSKNITLRTKGNPNIKEKYIKIWTENKFIPHIKFQLRPHKTIARGSSEISIEYLTEKIEDKIVPEPFNNFSPIDIVDKFYNIGDKSVGEVGVKTYTNVDEYDLSFFYEFPILFFKGSILIPKIGINIKQVKTDTKAKIKFWTFKFSQHIVKKTTFPTFYYGLEWKSPYIFNILNIEAEIEGKEAGKNTKFVDKFIIDLKTSIGLRIYSRFYIGIGFKYWKMESDVKVGSEKGTQNYKWHGSFSEFKLLF